MKRRKKQNTKLLKQESRHQKKQYFERLHRVMRDLGNPKAWGLLNSATYEMAYETRLRPHKFVAPVSGRYTISNSILKALNKDLSHLLQASYIELKNLKKRMSLYDYSLYAEMVFMMYRNVDVNKGVDAEAFRSCFPLFTDDLEPTRLDALMEINEKIILLCSYHSDVSGLMLRTVSNSELEDGQKWGPTCFFNNHVLDIMKAEKEPMKIDGHTRLVQQVYILGEKGFEALTRTPADLGIGGPMKDYPLKVYIQQHVFERIAERLSPHFAQHNYLFILPALVSPEPVKTGRSLSFLFPVTFGGIKLGYLVADVLGDRLVVRTFLLLTHNGTPEGDRLNELLGLKKADSKYWGIDRLKTLLFSDIEQNEKLKSLFCEAGCGGLFKVNKKLLEYGSHKEIATADMLSHYLGIE